jgi:hypothetical protein
LTRPLEQPHSENLLQLLNLAAQRRLRRTQGSGRAVEVAVLGHHGEIADQAEINVHQPMMPDRYHARQNKSWTLAPCAS